MKYTHTILTLAIIMLFILSAACTPPFLPGSAGEIQSEIYHYAQSFTGTPYRWGGETRTGMDCSGLVVRVYADVAGLSLPHNSARQYRSGKDVTGLDLEVGDLVFFRYSKNRTPNHVGIYMGRGDFIHASSSRGVVLSSLDNSYYRNRYAGARRILKHR